MFILLLLIIFCVVFFSLQDTKSKQEISQQQAKIENVETVLPQNIQSLTKLLNDSNICSEQWYQDVDDFILGLQEQNELLKKNDESKHQQLIFYHEQLITNLQAFKGNQTSQVIDDLENIFLEYIDYYKTVYGGVNDEGI